MQPSGGQAATPGLRSTAGKAESQPRWVKTVLRKQGKGVSRSTRRANSALKQAVPNRVL
jgi:hypothetical protein